MFASTALARRIEAAEAALTGAVASHARAARPSRPAIVRALGGGVAAFSGGSPFDKVIGLGFEPLVLEEVVSFEAEVRARGGAVQVEHCPLADPEVARALTERGYRLVGFENVLGLSLDRAGGESPVGPSPDRAIDTAPARPDEIAAWAELMTDAALHPDPSEGPASHESFAREALLEVERDMAEAPGFVPFLARRDGLLAGAANLRIHEGIAQLAGAATLPAHRRRGVQGALLGARLVHAARAGAEIAVVTTQAGSVSQKNVMKAGFSLLYARAILTSPA